MIANCLTIKRLTAVVVIALLVPLAAAQTLPDAGAVADENIVDVRRYSVEIIVFEYASSVAAGDEIFKPKSPPPETDPGEWIDSPVQTGNSDKVIEYGDVRRQTGAGTNSSRSTTRSSANILSDEDNDERDGEFEESPSLVDVDFRLLESDELTMDGIHKRLLDLDAYIPVLWGGWVQSVLQNEATPIIQLQLLGSPPTYIDGTLNLYLKNYLHLNVDITKEHSVATVQPIYRQEKPGRGSTARGNRTTFGSTDAQTLIFQIQEDRIFNSGHLRYYDHPRFGVLATVHRVEEPIQQEQQVEERSILSDIN